MTGFPITEGIHELYAQLKFLDGGQALGNSYYRFLDTYFVRQGQKAVIKKKAVEEILKKIRPFCIRTTNDQLKLPPKLYKTLVVPPTEQQAKALKVLNESFRLELGKVKVDVQYIFALIEKSLEICDGFIKDGEGRLAIIPTYKDEVLVETLEEIDTRKNKVLIWAAFRFTIEKLRRMLTRLGYGGILTLTGGTENVNLVVKRFQHDPTCRILLATPHKAAESITLTACKYAIYFSNAWSLDLRQNSEARIRRKGSERHNGILYVDFVTKNTVERQVLDSLRNKTKLVNELKKAFVEGVGEEVVNT